MGKGTVIKRDSICDCISELMQLWAKLEPNPERNFLKNDDNTDGISHKNCYKAMLNFLNHTKDEDSGFNLKDIKNDCLGRLLRGVWRTYEKELRGNKYNLKEEEAAYYGQGEDGKWGIFINLKLSNEGTDWLANHHIIFHEFFHNIYDVAKIKDIYLKNSDIIERFGNTIMAEVNNMLKEENDGTKKATEKRLNNLTYMVDKKHKAALYDIIGAILYKGKYGCNPANSNFYTEDKKECKDKFVCKCPIEFDEKNNKWVPECKDCKHITNCNHEIIRVRIKDCKFREISNRYKVSKCTGGECIFKNDKTVKFDYRIVCHLCTNDWCEAIYGHGSDYWKQEGKSFLKLLAEEAFVDMAASAIVNPKAYENIRKYLTKSEEIFIEILGKIVKGAPLT
jgi:hypothetical protein